MGTYRSIVIKPRNMQEIRYSGAHMDSIRTNVMIPRGINIRLREEALRMGTSVGEIIRCLVAVYLDGLDGRAWQPQNFGDSKAKAT